LLVGAAAFLMMFRVPITTLFADWWRDPDAGHGLLLAPLAVYLAWRAGLHPLAQSRRARGFTLLLAAVVLRYGAGLAAELFTMRFSLLAAIGALVIYRWGIRQVLHWWLPATLLILSIPVPALILNTLAFPLQLVASTLGAGLLEWRSVPVLVAGNVIQLPGYALFVTEACSGLRSLTALIALGVLIGGVWLSSPLSRLALVALTIPIAVLINSFRVFLTGFLIYFVTPALGEGFMHYSEGWVLFLVAFAFVGMLAAGFRRLESLVARMLALRAGAVSE
jgi:exosortase